MPEYKDPNLKCSPIVLTVREQLLQLAHDEAHPGMYCADCPKHLLEYRQVKAAQYYSQINAYMDPDREPPWDFAPFIVAFISLLVVVLYWIFV